MEKSLQDDFDAEMLFKYARDTFRRHQNKAYERFSQSKTGSESWENAMDEQDTYDNLERIVNVLEITVDNLMETQYQIENFANIISKLEGSSKEIQKDLQQIRTDIAKNKGTLIEKLKKILSKYELKTFEIGAPGIAKGTFELKDNNSS